MLPFLDSDVEAPTREKRGFCLKCRRPSVVCLCAYLPEKPVSITTDVHILQHPRERNRLLTTVPILQACLASDKINVCIGRRFETSSFADFHRKVSSSKAAVVLYPTEDAVELSDYVEEHKQLLGNGPLQLIVVDGTWKEAKALYNQNEFLQNFTGVKVTRTERSQFVIRTQPTKKSFSTLEAVTYALSVIENREDLIETLLQPLRALCRIQLEHGAVVHASKEDKAEGVWEIDHDFM